MLTHWFPINFLMDQINGRSVGIEGTILIILMKQLRKKVYYIGYRALSGISTLFHTPAVPFPKERFIR